MAVFLDTASCSLGEMGWPFRGTYCFYHQGYDVGDSNHVRNVGHFLHDYMSEHLRRLLYSHIVPVWFMRAVMQYFLLTINICMLDGDEDDDDDDDGNFVNGHSLGFKIIKWKLYINDLLYFLS